MVDLESVLGLIDVTFTTPVLECDFRIFGNPILAVFFESPCSYSTMLPQPYLDIDPAAGVSTIDMAIYRMTLPCVSVTQ